MCGLVDVLTALQLSPTRYISIYHCFQREGSRKYDAKNSTYIYICIYILIFSIVDLFSISIGNTKNHVATLICLEWHSVKISLTCPLQTTLMDNVDDYLYLQESENGNLKFEVDAHQLDLRLHHFSQFPLNVKKKKSWQVCDWLAKWLIMSGYMDLRRPRVYRRSNVGLVTFYRQTIIRSNTGLFWIGPMGTTFNEFYIRSDQFLIQKLLVMFSTIGLCWGKHHRLFFMQRVCNREIFFVIVSPSPCDDSSQW